MKSVNWKLTALLLIVLATSAGLIIGARFPELVASGKNTSVALPKPGEYVYAVFFYNSSQLTPEQAARKNQHQLPAPEVQQRLDEFHTLGQRHPGEAEFLLVDMSKDNWRDAVPQLVLESLGYDGKYSPDVLPEFAAVKLFVEQRDYNPMYSKVSGNSFDVQSEEDVFAHVHDFKMQ